MLPTRLNSTLNLSSFSTQESVVVDTPASTLQSAPELVRETVQSPPVGELITVAVIDPALIPGYRNLVPPPEMYTPIDLAKCTYSQKFYATFNQHTDSSHAHISQVIGLTTLEEMSRHQLARLPLFEQACVAYQEQVLKAIKEVLASSATDEETLITKWHIMACASNHGYLTDTRIFGSTPINLDGVDLRGMNLTSINLMRASLKATNLSGAYLIGADFSDADLTQVDLTDADLANTDLSSANLTRAKLVRADLSCAQLGNSNLTGVNLTGANLSGANLWTTNLTGANLTKANFAHAKLFAIKLDKANLAWVDFTNVDLKFVLLQGADFSLVNWTGVKLSEGNLTILYVAGVDISGLSSSEGS